MEKSNTFNRTLSDFTIPINDITISYRDSNSFEQNRTRIAIDGNEFLKEPLCLKISLEGARLVYYQNK